MMSTIGTEIPKIGHMRFSDKLNHAAQIRRLTNQRELAALAKVSKSSLNRWLAGISYPDAREALRLARVLEVPLEWLVDESTDEELPPGPLTEDERAVLDLYHALDLDRREALRRLATQPVGNPGTVTEKTVGVRDETEYEVRRQAEILRKVAAEEKASRLKRRPKMDRDHEGSNTK